MSDTALNDFLSRFGGNEGSTPEQAQQRLLAKRGETVKGQLSDALGNAGTVGSVNDMASQRAQGLTSLSSAGEGLTAEGIVPAAIPKLEGEAMTTADISTPDTGGGAGLLSAVSGVAGVVNTAMSIAPSAMKMGSIIKGDQFDTSAEGGGVGKAGGAIMEGAAAGADVGGKIGGLAGPVGKAIGTAVGAVGGGLASTFNHTAAKKEYYDNRKKFNLKEDALESAERKETYAMSEGLASLEGLKGLRQKQLGLIS